MFETLSLPELQLGIGTLSRSRFDIDQYDISEREDSLILEKGRSFLENNDVFKVV